MLTRFRLALAGLSLAIALCDAAAATYRNPVLPGDYPDPSITRVGDEYWATATSSEWAPFFPLLRSKDMVNWEHMGNVFDKRPAWAVGRFWAPEIWHHNGKWFVYYVGLKRGGPLAVAVATADKPTGPWTDHGPLVAQPVGSIDPVPVADIDGTLYLIWKEDGNSQKKPTPLWIQQLSPDGTKLVGEMKEILRNDVDWEQNLIEGPFVQRHGDYWYLFYSGAGCCGRGCSYALGVARAKQLLGPWEKCPQNPLMIGTDTWKCPGHGSVVTDTKGNDWLLYHAYHAQTFIYVGRQGLLDPVSWRDGWPVINEGKGPSAENAVSALAPQQPVVDFLDAFQTRLQPQWQWPQNMEPHAEVAGGKLKLSAAATRLRETGPVNIGNPDARQGRGGRGRANDPFVSVVIGVRTTTGNYAASTSIDTRSLKPGQSAGLSAFGDAENSLGVSLRDGQLLVWRRQRGQHQTLSTNAVSGDVLHVRLNAAGGHRFTFSSSTDGTKWNDVGNKVDLEGDFLPPWDRGIRVALVAGGADTTATFGPVRVTSAK